jgi:hypothetical protein
MTFLNLFTALLRYIVRNKSVFVKGYRWCRRGRKGRCRWCDLKKGGTFQNRLPEPDRAPFDVDMG